MLTGIKILDFTRLLPGPLATHLLSQMGAEITKIEHPERMDYMRPTGKSINGTASFYDAINHRKKHKLIDYQSDDGYEEIEELVRESDVLVEQFRPGVMKMWRLDYETLKKINPALIYASITGYGQNNSKRNEAGHDINYLSSGGLLSLLKDSNGMPLVPGFQAGDIGGGSYMAVMAIQAGIIQKLMTGKGCYLDIAITRGILPLITFPLQMEWSGLPQEKFNIINGKTLVNYTLYQCADGKWLALGALELKFWSEFCECAGKPEWKRNSLPELSVNQFPKSEIEQFFKEKTAAEWMTFFEGKDVCISLVLELNELADNEYLKEINAFESFTTPKGKQFNTIALPFAMRQ